MNARPYRFIFSWNGEKTLAYMNYHDKWGPIELNKFNLTNNKKKGKPKEGEEEEEK